MLFRLTIPRDTQLVGAVRQIAERAAQCAGYAAAEAARIGVSVGCALETVLAARERDAAGEQDAIEICIEREGVHLDVWLRYRGTNGDRPPVDPALSTEALRQGMDSVEFGREGPVTWCRLRRVLPREKVDHQCEVPPQ